MTHKAVAVVGLAFGDEGKGNLTDYHSSPATLVVRYNGGAQAGHSVCRDGKRHVFSHFGSGTLRGASTFLSRYFISNPILFFNELETLQGLGFEPNVYVDPAGMVTTLWDMLINQIVEDSRGQRRHGSCGVGINETIKRDEHVAYRLRVRDLKSGDLRDRLLSIQNKWVPERLHALGLEPSSEWMELFSDSTNVDILARHCEEYANNVWVTSTVTDFHRQNVVFEGAQGLLLDENHRFFPHVTHSHTGLKNVMELAVEMGMEHVDVVYVTRAYATRHGAGPFPHEVQGLSYEDATNVPHPWQGTLRFGHLDLDLLAESVQTDAKHVVLPIRRILAVTCLDQVGATKKDLASGEVAYWHKGQLCHTTPGEFIHRAQESIGAASCLIGFGPSAADVGTFLET